ncbi:MAG TPA: chloramphenicol acetyltransferase [Candidatus Faecousia intestinigallinarum]|nr:chloramphenicol acetyltransferase [Candidatus Faecousia intestinigallinarum]
MKYIDLETYPRRSHFEFFRQMAYPYVGFTAAVDVTKPLAAAKELGGGGFHACLWVIAQAANAVPELRQRIVGEQIVEFDHCDTAHTVAMPDGTFCNCRTESAMDFASFLQHARLAQEASMQRHGFVSTVEDETELIFVSCVPWISFTQVIQPTPIPADCNPRVVLGRYDRKADGRVEMPLAIQANHALADGRHLGQFYQEFARICDSL